MNTPTALITGASRGLGRALATALNDRGWRLVIIDGRDARRLAATAAACPDRSRRRLPGDVTDPAHRAASPPPSARTSTCWSTTPASSGPARSPGWSSCVPRSSRGCSPSTPSPAGGAAAVLGSRPAPASSPSAPTPPWRPTRLGRLRREQGRARPPHRRPRHRAPGPADLRRDPGDMATDMQQAAFPGEDTRPSGAGDRDPHARPDRRRAAQRALSGRPELFPFRRRRRAGDDDLHASAARRGHRAAGVGRPRRTRSGSCPSGRPGPSPPCSRICRTCSSPGDLVVVNTSAIVPAAWRPGGRTASPFRCTCRPRWTTAAGWWRSAVPTTRGGPGRGAGHGAGSAARGPGDPRGGLRAAGAPGSGAHARSPGPRRRPTCPARAAHHRYGYLHGSFPLASYQNVYATEPGSAECVAPGALQRPAAGAAPRPGHPGRAADPAHRGLQLHEPPYPERFAVPGNRAAGDQHPPGRPEGDRRRNDRDPGAGDRDGRRRRHPAAHGWTDLVLGPDRPRAGRDRPDHRPARARASHLSLLEAVAGPARGRRLPHCHRRALPMARVRRLHAVPAGSPFPSAPGGGALQEGGPLGRRGAGRTCTAAHPAAGRSGSTTRGVRTGCRRRPSYRGTGIGGPQPPPAVRPVPSPPGRRRAGARASGDRWPASPWRSPTAGVPHPAGSGDHRR